MGSPPQVRGKRSDVPVQAGAKRITPAGAGKTVKFGAKAVTLQDHPRRCGENRMSRKSRDWFFGSPPQVRGKPYLFKPVVISHRITPAGAGKTEDPTNAEACNEDHPRRCGENGDLIGTADGGGGSPPQVRGKLIFIQIIKP